MVELFARLRDRYAVVSVEACVHERPELMVRNMPDSVSATITLGVPGSGEMLVAAPGRLASKGTQEAPELVVWYNETEFPERLPSIAATVGNCAEAVCPVTYAFRSEERRGGGEGRAPWAPC